MPRYVKKPVIIDAVQFTVGELVLMPEWFKDNISHVIDIKNIENDSITKDSYAEIKTLEGIMRCNLGDYVIKGVKGELYPCRKDIFEETYELTF